MYARLKVLPARAARPGRPVVSPLLIETFRTHAGRQVPAVQRACLRVRQSMSVAAPVRGRSCTLWAQAPMGAAAGARRPQFWTEAPSQHCLSVCVCACLSACLSVSLPVCLAQADPEPGTTARTSLVAAVAVAVPSIAVASSADASRARVRCCGRRLRRKTGRRTDRERDRTGGRRARHLGGPSARASADGQSGDGGGRASPRTAGVPARGARQRCPPLLRRRGASASVDRRGCCCCCCCCC